MTEKELGPKSSKIPLSFEKAIAKFGLYKLAQKLKVRVDGEDEAYELKAPTPPPPPPANLAAAAEFLKFKKRIVNFNPRDYFITEEIVESVWQGPKLIEKVTHTETLQSKYKWEVIYDRDLQEVVKETIPLRVRRFYEVEEIEGDQALTHLLREGYEDEEKEDSETDTVDEEKSESAQGVSEDSSDSEIPWHLPPEPRPKLAHFSKRNKEPGTDFDVWQLIDPQEDSIELPLNVPQANKKKEKRGQVSQVRIQKDNLKRPGKPEKRSASRSEVSRGRPPKCPHGRAHQHTKKRRRDSGTGTDDGASGSKLKKAAKKKGQRRRDGGTDTDDGSSGMKLKKVTRRKGQRRKGGRKLRKRPGSRKIKLLTTLDEYKAAEENEETVIGRQEFGGNNYLEPEASSDNDNSDDLPSTHSVFGSWQESDKEGNCLDLLDSTEDVVKEINRPVESVFKESHVQTEEPSKLGLHFMKGSQSVSVKSSESTGFSVVTEESHTTPSSSEIVESETEVFDEIVLMEKEEDEVDQEPPCKPLDGKRREKKKEEDEVALTFSVSRLSLPNTSNVEITTNLAAKEKTSETPVEEGVTSEEELQDKVVMMASSQTLALVSKRQEAARGENETEGDDESEVASSINLCGMLDSEVRFMAMENDTSENESIESDPILRKEMKWQKESINLVDLPPLSDHHKSLKVEKVEETESKMEYLDDRWKAILEKELATWIDSEVSLVKEETPEEKEMEEVSREASFNYILAPFSAMGGVSVASLPSFKPLSAETVAVEVAAQSEHSQDVFPEENVSAILEEEAEEVAGKEQRGSEQEGEREKKMASKEDDLSERKSLSEGSTPEDSLLALQKYGLDQLKEYRDERRDNIAYRKEKRMKFQIMKKDAQELMEYEKTHQDNDNLPFPEHYLKCTFLDLREYRKKVHKEQKIKRYDLERIRAKQAYDYFCATSDMPMVETVKHNLDGRVINLELYGVKPGSIHTITESIKRSKTVKCFNLRKNRLSPLDCYHVGEMLREQYYIRYLNLSFCGLTPECLEYILVGVKESRTLESLDLSNNHLGDKGAISLAESLVSHPTLKSLNLSGNKITNNAGAALGELLGLNPLITEINLSKNNLDGAKEIKGILSHAAKLKTLKKLDMSWNGMDQRAILDTFRGFCAKALTHLNLSYNEFNGADAADGFNKIITKAGTLEYFDISYNYISPPDTTLLLSGINEDCPVNYLKMKNMYVSQEFISALRALHNKGGKMRVWVSGINSNYEKPVVDMKPILLKRLNFCGNKPKKKKDKRDFGKILLKLEEEGKLEPMKKEQFVTFMANLNFPNLDDGLPEDLGKLFLNTGKQVDLREMLEAYLALYPDTQLDPPPPPKKKKSPDDAQDNTKKKKK